MQTWIKKSPSHVINNILGVSIEFRHTLESEIDVAPGINVATGTFAKNNKHNPLNKQIIWIIYTSKKSKKVKKSKTNQKSINIAAFNKDISSGKPPKNYQA